MRASSTLMVSFAKLTDAMTHNPSFALMLVALLANIETVGAQQMPDPRVADLVKAGSVRIGLFPPQYIKDMATGKLTGVWAETARALAARLGVKAVLLEYPTPLAVAECLKAGACDAVFLGLAPRFADAGDFSIPFVHFDYTFLVPHGSSIGGVIDADLPGARIAAVHGHASSLALSQLLKHAELVWGDAPGSAFELLRTGKAVALASTRPALIEYSAQLPGSRVLQTSYGANVHRVVVPKGHAGRLGYINEFLEKAKASGWLQSAIERAGPRGLTIVPPGDPN